MTNDLERTVEDHPENAPSEEESMEPVFSSSNNDAEMECAAIQGLLESNDIPAVVMGSRMIPSLEFQVQVPAHMLSEAKQLIREARQDGRRNAAEAEAAGEE